MSAETAPRADRLLPILRRLDLRVIAPALLLALVGLVSIASDQPVYFSAQLRWLAVSVVVLVGVVMVPYPRILAAAYPFYALSVLLLVAVLIPGIGHSVNGSQRWLRFGGVNLQPSELAKVAHVLALARYVRFRRDHRTLKGLFTPFALTLVPMLFILKQPDLGTALMMVPVLFAMLWVAGARSRHLGFVVVLGIASLPLVYTVMAPHQKARVDAFVAPLVQVDGPAASAVRPDTYQLDESLSAVAGGGLTGQGFGQGRQNRLGRVPFSWTDFVFSVHAEEWGFLGVALLLGLEAAFLLGLATVALDLKEPAGRLLSVGALVLFGTQAVVNLAMTMGLAPITGIPLPFLSYGGSAMVTSCLLVGLALNARAREPVTFSRGDFD